MERARAQMAANSCRRSGTGCPSVGMSGDDVGKPCLQVDVVHLCGDDQGIEEGSARAAGLGTGEEP